MEIEKGFIFDFFHLVGLLGAILKAVAITFIHVTEMFRTGLPACLCLSSVLLVDKGQGQGLQSKIQAPKPVLLS